MISDAKEQVDVETLVETRTPQQVEADMVKASEDEALAQAAAMPAADRAAMFFQSLYYQWEAKLNGLSAKELRRLAAALVHYPLEEMMPKTLAGQEALYMGLRLTDAKLVMRETIVMEEREALDNKEKKEYNRTQAEAQSIVDSTVTTFEHGAGAQE